MMSHQADALHKPRRKWLIPTLSAFAALVVGVFGNLLANDLEQLFGLPYRWIVWGIFAVFAIITIITSILASRHEDPFLSHGTHVHVQGNFSTGGDFVGRDKIVGGDVVGRDKIVYKTPPPTISALHQLPPPPPDFTGREAELTELMNALKTGGVTLSGLHGMGGIGKTALALVLAEKLAPNFPDAQIFLDLKGVSARSLTAAEAMAHVIRSFHREAKLPESEAELAALYRSVLHSQRALLLMDNARDAKQVEPLLPPAPCCLLVTSRQHFTLPGLYAKNLDILPADEARALLLKIAPSLDAHAEKITRLCGYLPLALRLAASALAERRDLSPADYVQRLTEAKTRLQLIEASLSLSYDLLSPERQKLWRALAVFPDTFDVPAAAAVWEMQNETAQEALSGLLAYSLLEWNATTRRYRLHDLARLFAQARLSETEHNGCQYRHAAHYETVLRNADELYLKGGDWLLQGLARFDLEWGNIQAGQAWAQANTEKDKMAARLGCDYAAAGSYFLDLRQHPSERILWLEAALTAARYLQDRRMEGMHLGNLGNAYAALGETRKAIEFYEQALMIARETGDRRNEVVMLGNLGNAYADLGEPRKAIKFYEQCLIIHREIGAGRGECTDLWNMSLALDKLGERQKAIEYAEAALKIFEQIEDPAAAKVRQQLAEWQSK
jgi:tetratricopeptide (TPR) repeat protein